MGIRLACLLCHKPYFHREMDKHSIWMTSFKSALYSTVLWVNSTHRCLWQLQPCHTWAKSPRNFFCQHIHWLSSYADLPYCHHLFLLSPETLQAKSVYQWCLSHQQHQKLPIKSNTTEIKSLCLQKWFTCTHAGLCANWKLHSIFAVIFEFALD